MTTENETPKPLSKSDLKMDWGDTTAHSWTCEREADCDGRCTLFDWVSDVVEKRWPDMNARDFAGLVDQVQSMIIGQVDAHLTHLDTICVSADKRSLLPKPAEVA